MIFFITNMIFKIFIFESKMSFKEILENHIETTISKFINEIAEKYDMNLNTVKTKIRKARKMLREAVLEKNPGMIDRLNEYF